MKEIVIAAAMIVGIGGACSMSDNPSQQDAPALTGDIEDYINPGVLWIRASGPNGERDSQALPLYEAIFARDGARVAALLDQGRSPDLSLHPGHLSPLATAVALNDLALVKVLLQHGADIDLVSGVIGPGTPLAMALNYGRFYTLDDPDFAIFHYLIDAGADVNKVYDDGNDIASDTLTFGRMHLTNVVLDHGFNHDLPGLKRVLEHLVVVEGERREQKRAIARIDRMLNEGSLSRQ